MMIKLFKNREPSETLEDTLAIQKKDAHLLNKALFNDREVRNNFLPYIRGQYKGEDNLDTVGFYNECALEKWIDTHGETRYGHLKVFQDFKEIHTNGHLCAAEIASLHRADEQQLALEILNGPFLEMAGLAQRKAMEIHKALAFSKVRL